MDEWTFNLLKEINMMQLSNNVKARLSADLIWTQKIYGFIVMWLLIAYYELFKIIKKII